MSIRATLILLLSAGCADYEVSEMAMQDYTSPTADDFESAQQMRIDVFPSDATSGILPQTFQLYSNDQPLQDISLSLAPTVEYSGKVIGFSLFPHSEPSRQASDGAADQGSCIQWYIYKT